MLKVILVLIVSIYLNNSYASTTCAITLKAKTDTAKNAKLSGVSFSAKQLDALKSVCNVSIELMSDADKVQDYKESLERKALKASK